MKLIKRRTHDGFTLHLSTEEARQLMVLMGTIQVPDHSKFHILIYEVFNKFCNHFEFDCKENKALDKLVEELKFVRTFNNDRDN